MKVMENYTNNVFINCPFDDHFTDIFNAMVFAIFDCGFIARCAREENDSGQVRIEKIFNIIKQSKFGIHDISRTELDTDSKLPRFNMPLELGIFMGAKKFGDKIQKQKICLITDKESFRYNKYISDINGQDIQSHKNNPTMAVKVISDWLRNSTKRQSIPGGEEIARRFKLFSSDLPAMCEINKIEVAELGFNDYTNYVSNWIRQNPTI